MKLNYNLTSIDGLKIVFGILAGATIILEIYLADSTTKTEAALFNILQFVFSIGFAWVLSKSSSEKEFQKSQKKFAISAYRRILEINNTTKRLLDNISNYLNEFPKGYYHQIKVLEQICVSIKNTVKSSIADWSDIIGDEIKTISKIEDAKNIKGALSYEKIGVRSSDQEESRARQITERLESLEDNINGLFDSLPAQLQIYERDRQNSVFEIEKWFDSLSREINDTGYLTLDGFWENDKGFSKQICKDQIGEKVTIKKTGVGERSNAIIAFNASDEPMGVITNCTDLSYDNFSEVLWNIFNSKPIHAKLIECETEISKGGRVYFSVQTLNE